MMGVRAALTASGMPAASIGPCPRRQRRSFAPAASISFNARVREHHARIPTASAVAHQSPRGALSHHNQSRVPRSYEIFGFVDLHSCRAPLRRKAAFAADWAPTIASMNWQSAEVRERRQVHPEQRTAATPTSSRDTVPPSPRWWKKESPTWRPREGDLPPQVGATASKRAGLLKARRR